MLNKVTLIGNVGQDPETQMTKNGTAVVNLSLATSETYKKDGEKKTETEWHRVVFFGKLAEIVAAYVKKGQTLYIEGKIKTDSYEKDGQKHYATKIVASEMKMIGGKKDDSAGQKKEATSGEEDDVCF